MMRMLAVTLFIAACSSSLAPKSFEDVGPENDDLLSSGTPSTKWNYQLGFASLQGDGDHYDYDTTSYAVREEMIHQTRVTVAVHLASGVDSEQFAETMLSCFHAAWHVFDGYAFDQYTIKLRDPADERAFSLSASGVSLSNQLFSAGGYEAACHEVFHSWIGKLIRHEPDGSENLFQLETWISEGAAFYYGIRHESLVIEPPRYQSAMDSHYETYQSSIGGPYDRSVAALAATIESNFTSPAYPYFNARVTLLNYLLDRELIARGTNEDAVLRALYVQFGLTETPWRQADLDAILMEQLGDDAAGFVAEYVEGDSELPLDDSFEFFPR